MPPKASPKPVTSGELMTASSNLISIAQRMLVNKQIVVDVYKSLVTASNNLTDIMVTMEAPADNKKA